MMTKFSSPSHFCSALYFQSKSENTILSMQIKQASSSKSIVFCFYVSQAQEMKMLSFLFFLLLITPPPEIKEPWKRSSNHTSEEGEPMSYCLTVLRYSLTRQAFPFADKTFCVLVSGPGKICSKE